MALLEGGEGRYWCTPIPKPFCLSYALFTCLSIIILYKTTVVMFAATARKAPERVISSRLIIIGRRALYSTGRTPPPPPPLCNTVLDTIGNTPLVRLDRFCAALGLSTKTTILAKLENTNPGMSKKDRIAYRIIEDAKAAGQLQEGQWVVELTSGNTGTGLAIVCSILGHPFCAVMSEGNSRERAQMMRFLGAHVVLVPQAATASSAVSATSSIGTFTPYDLRISFA